MKKQLYQPNDPMVRLIADDYRLIHVMSRFGITVGFGDQSVEEVCRRANVDPATFLVVVNFVKYGALPTDAAEIAVESLLHYLRQSHAYFLEYCLPSIRRRVLGGIEMSGSEVSFLIIRLFDEYVQQVRTHMEYEEQNVFPYISRLLGGETPADYGVDTYSAHHEQVADKLHELKRIILKYSPSQSDANVLNDVLYDIYRTENDLENHCRVEDEILVPAIRLLEHKVRTTRPAEAPYDSSNVPQDLSNREKDVVRLVVKGLTNKEIADKLFLSLHTVTTHRRNIARKLEIHSPTGLTIYAIVNGLVKIEELDQKSEGPMTLASSEASPS